MNRVPPDQHHQYHQYHRYHHGRPSTFFTSAEIPKPSESSGTHGMAFASDDMIVSREEEMVWKPEFPANTAVHYLAIDTNVFISHLNLIRTVHSLLLTLRPSPVILLIPSIVIHELDSLKASKAPSEPNSPITLGRLVQYANAWLLDTHRTRRKTGHGALRCQSLKERWDQTIRHHVDQAKVTLWTDDKNLSVKAESNDIPTIGGNIFGLTTFFDSLEEQFPQSLWDQVHKLEDHHSLKNGDDRAQNNGNASGNGNGNCNGNGNGIMNFDHDMESENGDPDQQPDNYRLQDTSSNITSLLLDRQEQSQAQEERRYPYLLPSTNPQLASLPASTSTSSTSTPTSTSTSATASTSPAKLPPSAWHAFPTSKSTPTTPTRLKSRSTPPMLPPTSPNSIPMDRNNSSSSYQSASISISMNSPPSNGSTLNSPIKNGKSSSRRTSRSSSTSTSDLASTSTSPSKRPTTSTPKPATTTNMPSRILLTSIQLSLRPLLISLLQHSPQPHHRSSPSPDQPIGPNEVLERLSITLEELDEHLKMQGESPSSKIRLLLIRSSSYVRTINDYIENHLDWKKSLDRGNRKIRPGEASESLMKLRECFRELGLDDGGQDLSDVIKEINRSD
uniref:PIN domain-containing protein n=1 Tax=Kwoniella dejecticola CBS 10117 TaxID=1296121 RepID=A0A1A6A5G6_9TREE|nr:uncharacterized protein I303_04636 [Kwoniella dejecticola CBS 10117]OBR85301.1 hypothetical protein I303_04636 [Kwoniella dejecticola CBS 10117]